MERDINHLIKLRSKKNLIQYLQIQNNVLQFFSLYFNGQIHFS